jgi:chromosome segregation ATPase
VDTRRGVDALPYSHATQGAAGKDIIDAPFATSDEQFEEWARATYQCERCVRLAMESRSQTCMIEDLIQKLDRQKGAYETRLSQLRLQAALARNDIRHLRERLDQCDQALADFQEGAA